MNSLLEKQIKERFELGFLPTHMTHIDNFQSTIGAKGIFSHNKMIQNSCTFRDIANNSVQNIRSSKKIPTTNHFLHDYVPLYFALKTPMISSLREINDALILLVFSYDVLSNLSCVISDGNAADHRTTFRAFSSLDDLSILNVKAINSVKYAHDNEIKRCKQAELLVLKFLPVEYLRSVICPSNMVKNKIDAILNQSEVTVRTSIGDGRHYYR